MTNGKTDLCYFWYSFPTLYCVLVLTAWMFSQPGNSSSWKQQADPLIQNVKSCGHPSTRCRWLWDKCPNRTVEHWSVLLLQWFNCLWVLFKMPKIDMIPSYIKDKLMHTLVFLSFTNTYLHIHCVGAIGCLCPLALSCYTATKYGENCCLGCLPGGMTAIRTHMRLTYGIQVRTVHTCFIESHMGILICF